MALRADGLKAAQSECWANEVEVMRLASLAWVALAQQKSNDGLALLRQAVDIEDQGLEDPSSRRRRWAGPIGGARVVDDVVAADTGPMWPRNHLFPCRLLVLTWHPVSKTQAQFSWKDAHRAIPTAPTAEKFAPVGKISADPLGGQE